MPESAQIPLEPHVLFEDRQVLVVCKPAGMLSQGDRTDDGTLLDWARKYLASQGSPDQERRSLFVVPVHRLDRPVSGIMVLARSSKSAGRLGQQFRASSVRKGYLAVALGMPTFFHGVIDVWMKKNRKHNLVEARSQPFEGAVHGRTHAQFLVRHEEQSLVALFPFGGKSHQLRASLSSIRCPIVGDLKYGAPEGFGHFIALHAHTITFVHPTRGVPVRVTASIPDEWLEHFEWLEDYLPPQLLP
jgi:23S rRNA pseudouridine1911/1915/1917 synthase